MNESHLNPPEPLIVGKCEYCGDDLYDGCDYAKCTNTNRWFCDESCYGYTQREEGELVTEVIGDCDYD